MFKNLEILQYFCLRFWQPLISAQFEGVHGTYSVPWFGMPHTTCQCIYTVWHDNFSTYIQFIYNINKPKWDKKAWNLACKNSAQLLNQHEMHQK